MPVFTPVIRKYVLSFGCAGAALLVMAAPVKAELKINPYPNKPAPQSAVAAEPIDLMVAPAPPAVQSAPVVPAPVYQAPIEPIDIVQDKKARMDYLEQDFRNEMVETDKNFSGNFRAPQVIERDEPAAYVRDVQPSIQAASPVVSQPQDFEVDEPIAGIPLLRMDDLQLDNPQSGLYVPRKDVAARAVRVQAEPITQPDASQAASSSAIVSAPQAASVEPAASAPTRFNILSKARDSVKDMFTPSPKVEALPEPLYASTKSLNQAQQRYAEPVTSAPPQDLLRAPAPAAAAYVPPSYVAPTAAPVAVAPPPTVQGWNTFAGANVHETLEVWSKEAGVELLWADQDSDFDVMETISDKTSFEEAVQALLEQYDDARLRPVGSLHVDPKSGMRTLLIEVVEG